MIFSLRKILPNRVTITRSFEFKEQMKYELLIIFSKKTTIIYPTKLINFFHIKSNMYKLNTVKTELYNVRTLNKRLK